jgi:NADP-dependent 3-hydroxy acid dehydrogenase YdfG
MSLKYCNWLLLVGSPNLLGEETKFMERTNETRLSDKVVVVTGASSGIGEAIARRLGGAGAKLILGARRTERLQAVASEIRECGGYAVAIPADVTRYEDVMALVTEAKRRFGKLDVMVNNAGVMPLSLLRDRKLKEWERMIDVNLRGVLHGVAAALPVFEEQGRGHVINVTSVADRMVFPTASVYCATKHAVRALSEGLRLESPSVRVTVIAPGATVSELAEGISDPELRRAAIENFRKELISADAIARAVLFAVEQPSDVDVNEMVVRPTAQAF